MAFINEHGALAYYTGLFGQLVILFGMPFLGAVYWPGALSEDLAPIEGGLVGLVAAILTLMKVNDIGTNNPDFGSSNFDK